MNKKSTLVVKIGGVDDRWVVYFTVRENKRHVYAIPKDTTFPFHKLVAGELYAILCTQNAEGLWEWETAFLIDATDVLIIT